VTDFDGAGENAVFALSEDDVEPGSVEIVYNIFVPEDDGDELYEWGQTLDESSMSVGDTTLPILGDQEFEVTTDGNTAVMGSGLVARS